MSISIGVFTAMAMMPALVSTAQARPVTLHELPSIVQDAVFDLHCPEGEKPEYRLGELVHVLPLSGPRSRDYLIDTRGFYCRRANGHAYNTGRCGSGGCGFHVFVKKRGKWVCGTDGTEEVSSASHCEYLGSWRVIRRPGKKAVLVINGG